MYTRLVFAEGEIDFIAAGPLTDVPWVPQVVLGRMVLVETVAEILAKKIRYRADNFKARDLLDPGMALRQMPEVTQHVAPWLNDKREPLLERLHAANVSLREDFEAIDRVDVSMSYDECLEVLRDAMRVGT